MGVVASPTPNGMYQATRYPRRIHMALGNHCSWFHPVSYVEVATGITSTEGYYRTNPANKFVNTILDTVPTNFREIPRAKIGNHRGNRSALRFHLKCTILSRIQRKTLKSPKMHRETAVSNCDCCKCGVSKFRTRD